MHVLYFPHSPWVANAIGKGNRHYFLLLIWLNLYAALISAIIGSVQVGQGQG